MFTTKFYLFFVVIILCAFILFIASADASWQNYQNDLRNTGIANGTGYFPLTTANFSNGLYGMDFQPLVDDIDNDGYNELIIFSNDFLKIFDYELNLLDEKFVGTILGQPTIFNNKIIFNSRINDKNYLFAYQYGSSGMAQKFNITLSSDANFGGIKCLNLNGSDSCVFKDKLNYIHIVNIASKTDSSYNISAYNETRQTIPAIGDIDNDGNAEAVFWLDSNGNNQYGLTAFDLSERKVKWITDDIYASMFGASSTYALKGQPVLVDLNNDNKLEIAASVFYDDNLPNFDPYNDWFTELLVYSYNGSRLFSKCELNRILNNGCNDGGSIVNKWEGTNPFVLDADKNGIDDICFIKDKKHSGNFKSMTINCYNYSGDVILDSELSPTTDTVKTAIVADMNNDGNKEIVTENRIYALNGTSIFSYELGSNFVIPVDIDNNARLDLIWTKNGMIKLFVDDAGAIKVSDVLIKPENPSVDDSLICSWKANGNNKVVSANVSWYKNNNFYSNEIAACANNTLCTTIDNIQYSALKENDVWRCSVTAFENNKKLENESDAAHSSLPKSSTALILGKSSEWTDFNKNRFSYGVASGNGYFSKSAISTIFYNSSGMDFQPMVADIDNDGANEIVLFANNSLVVLNKSLNAIAQRRTGNLRGQFDIENMDNDAFIEIIAIVNNINQDNFTIFEFDGSGIKIERSFDVSPQNGFQDIRCLDFDNDNVTECIFRDYNGIVHSYQVNATNQNDDELNINISDVADNAVGSKANIAPSFVDFDRDNDLDALFWFNDNFVVIDSSRNIILNVDVGTLNAVFQNEPTFLGLKFINLDKAGDYEIAVAYRNDYVKGVSFKTDISLSLFNSQGKAIFSKIIDFYNVNPCLNDNVHCLGFGSDLFVYDYNKDGFDDIGIYVEGTSSSPFGTFIKFFDRNGNEIASNKVEFGEGSSVPQAVTLADMDGDNELELILKRRIYNLDGTVLYNFTDTANKVPIAVDTDKNKGLDLLWFDDSNVILLLDNNSYEPDLSIEERDISFNPLNGTSALVTAIVHNNGGSNLDNVKVKLTNTETLESTNGTMSIKGSGSNDFAAILNLKRNEKVMAQVNYDSSIGEDNDKNNFAEKIFEGLPYVYVSVGAGQNPQLPLKEIKSYIKNNLIAGYHTEDSGAADVQVYIGKDNSFNLLDRFDTLDKYGWGYKSYSIINYFDKSFDEPYAGIVGSYVLDGKDYIAVYGNSIDGDIAAAKEFIKRQADFLARPDSPSEISFLVDNENVEAIGVYDYLHQPGNEQFYGDDSKEFANVVKNALNGETFSTEIKTVETVDGVGLRLKHLIPNRSSIYMEILNFTGVPVEVPVVMARGIHSNLTTWETLAGELADFGRDTWLIEITGGPNTECESCSNYNFSDLTDKYWPALINGILNFTGKEKIQYVGHSNGGRVAIESLANGKIDSNKIDTLIGVAVPSAFEGYSTFGNYFGKYGGQIMEELSGKSHVSMTEVGIELRKLCKIDAGCRLLTRGLVSDNKMSFNTDKQLYLWIINTTDEHIGKNLQLNNFYIIQGWVRDDEKDITHDFIVTEQDEKAIYGNIESSNKKHYKIWGAHTAGWNPVSLPDKTLTKNIIKNALNKYQSNEINST